jgi:peroxiredoxin
MGLQEELEAFMSDFLLRAPPGRVEFLEAKIKEVRGAFAFGNAVGVGDLIPDVSLPNVRGETVRLHDLLASGPVVLAFYRGGWCPYCNIQLRAYQAALPDMERLGARLVAISPQLPDGSLSTAETNALTFEVLSDLGNAAARKFGIVYALPDDLRALLVENNYGTPRFNGDDSWELPVPATYVIDPEGRVVLSHLDVDYRRRLEPDAILSSLARLGGATR